MKIKNIQEFRTYWKNKENFVGFDENFIGTKHNNTNGFYRIVNGTVHDIKADLTPKLQNAQDEQAIYEFLQNAADSNSNDCAIIYDEDYFMVLNNGEPFTIKDVEAIINSFQGTKADKSQKENCEKIGRYGIGFKLVHRLVGKSDGAKELIENLNGPIVFSWFKENQIKNLFDYQADQNLSFDNQIDDEESSWLFKIALTCFPTMPKERVKNLDYDETIIYKNEELLELVNFLNKHKTKIDNLNLDKGSLFFLKFGENKHQKLEESFKNINSGIGYSLNTLKTLDKVILQDNLVERIKIERIDFKIQPSDTAFKKIDPEFPDCPIDIMFGYRTDKYEALRTAPNIYQFFPMRNEAHGLSFLIHASSFAKVTDRTKLDDQGESNIHTLSYLSNELQDKLKNDFQINDKEKARNIFKSIIFSEISERQNSELIVNNLLKPLVEYFKMNVPTELGSFSSFDNVIIKATKLNLTPSNFGIEKDWIYWSNSNENKELIQEIKEKLEVKKWNIGKLIENGKISEINTWIADLDDEQYSFFLKELDEHIPKVNIENIEFIKCSDDSFYSINDLKDNRDIIIEFDKISKIQEILIELDFTVSTVNISKFPRLKLELAKSISYLSETNEVKLFENYIYTSTSENELSPPKKRDLFLCMKGLHGVGHTLLSEFELFCNSQNEIKPLNQLVDSKISLPDFLDEYKILDSENIFDEIRKPEYLRNNETIYGSIIYPKWNEIINKNKFSHSNIKTFYLKVKDYYSQSITTVETLENGLYIFNGEIFLNNDNIFYNSKLTQFDTGFRYLSDAIKSITGFSTPVKHILQFFDSAPFNTRDIDLNENLNDCELSAVEAKQLLKFSDLIGVNLFSNGYFESANNQLLYKSNTERKQYYSSNNKIISFIDENLSSNFLLLPNELSEYKENVIKNSNLQNAILVSLDNEYESHLEILIEILSGENLNSVIADVEQILFRHKENYIKEDFEYKFIEIIKDEQIEDIRSKLIIASDGNQFKLNQTSSSNEITFENHKYKLQLSDILPNSTHFANTSILSQIVNSLEKTGIAKNKLIDVFAVEKEITNGKFNEILDELLETENSLVKNEYQLAFVLLYNQYVKTIDLSKIEAFHINNEKYAINDSLYLNKFQFISESETLDTRYNQVAKILKLNKNNPVFNAKNSDCKILLCPYFEYFDSETPEFYCKNIKTGLNESDSIHLINFIFEFWSASNENKRLIIAANLSKMSDNPIKSILGFNFDEIILIQEISLDDENPPDWLKIWHGDNENKLEFLYDLGVNTVKSPIVKIRKSFISDSLFNKSEIPNNAKLNSSLLENTFEWLAENEIEINNDSKFQLLETVAKEIDIVFDRVLNEEKLENNSMQFDEVFDTNYYKDWSEEFGYTICFYDGEMPYNIQHNDYILKETHVGNIAMIDETEIIYLNKNYFKTENDLIKINSLGNEYLTSDAEKELFKNIASNNSNLPANLAELQKENEELKRRLQEATEPDEGQEKGSASKERQKAQSYETKLKAKEILSKEHGFDCSNWSDNHIPSTIIKGVKHLGTEITLIIRSAMSGRLHLHPNEWILFDDPNTFLVVRVGESDFVVTGNNENIKETLKEDNETISVNFDTNSFGIEGIDSLSKVLSGAYLVGTGYVFNSPSFSYSNKLEDLGQSITNTGLISGKTDDDF